ncbi:olfactory receptor 5V1-like [Spea bombifrons]|uniref:olfactory receptor 5V1-like n=1 Tax=Spea bombifrons TaxID=233779 RepID=UPI00234A9F7B|nr:olfactory receptor 5V1-like [Spea bombifrons]
MENLNQTIVRKFILLGLSTIPHLQAFSFLLFLLMYVFTLSGNLLLITVVRINTQLQTPMYFFLTNLSFIDICFSSAIVPNILKNTISNDKSISFVGCATQMCFNLGLGATESVILAVMAFDRYAAICKPLQYNTIMDKKLCVRLTAGSWSVSFLNSVIHTAVTFLLPFCKSNNLNHFFCEMPPLLRLSCRDTTSNEIAMYISCGLLGLSSFLLTLMSYVHIISNILKIRSNTGRHKAFSTCASHLTVVSLYYVTIMVIYMRPRSTYSPNRERVLSILYTVVAPMLNPIIYSIRNKEVKGTLRKNKQL